MHKFSEDVRKKMLPYIEDPEAYKDEYLKWLHTEKPVYEKDNPNHISQWRQFKDAAEVRDWYKNNVNAEKELDDDTVERYLRLGSMDPNPEYEALPEKIRDESEWLFIEEAPAWDIRVMENGDLDFAVYMDNFDYQPFLEFAYEQVTGIKCERDWPGQIMDKDFAPFIQSLGDTYVIYDRENERFKLPKLSDIKS